MPRNLTKSGAGVKGYAILLEHRPTPGRDGGTGRRSGLKIRRPQGRGGSTPPPGTIKINKIRSTGIFGCLFLCPNYDQRSVVQLMAYYAPAGKFVFWTDQVTRAAINAAKG